MEKKQKILRQVLLLDSEAEKNLILNLKNSNNWREKKIRFFKILIRYTQWKLKAREIFFCLNLDNFFFGHFGDNKNFMNLNEKFLFSVDENLIEFNLFQLNSFWHWIDLIDWLKNFPINPKYELSYVCVCGSNFYHHIYVTHTSFISLVIWKNIF